MSTLETLSEQGVVAVDEIDLDQRGLLAEIAEGAARRDKERVPPFDEIDKIRGARLGAIRIPTALGGGGHSVRELLGFVVRLAEADPNVAHILRNHYAFVETRIRLASTSGQDRWLDEVANGAIIGLASGELGSAPAGQNYRGATLAPTDDGYLLNGVKFYSTGSLYSDWIVVQATVIDGPGATIVLPTHREGIIHEDDWDGIGQRLTGSGTTRLVDVRVDSSEVVLDLDGTAGRSPHQATFAQLYLTTVIAGIVRNVLRDAIALVNGRERSFYHAPTERPSEDPILQQHIGVLSANAHAAETLVLAAGDGLDLVAKSRVDGIADPDLVLEASLRAAKAKIVIDDIAQRSASMLFDLGGASAVRAQNAFDRHWRNIRTIASHNPSSYKARSIGALEVLGQPLPNGAYF